MNTDILNTATFVIERDQPIATVYFVRMLGGLYAITNKHAVENTQVSIRFNLQPRGTEDKPIAPDKWVKHKETDIAILPLDPPIDSRYDVGFIDDRDIKSYMDHYTLAGIPDNHPHPLRFGPGDEVFTLGLFEGHPGEHASRPVVRFGHIALVPPKGEKIEAQIWPPPNDLVPIDAFLVEMATWPGQSGSPVFLRPKITNQNRSSRRPNDERTFLIGMLQGFYPAEQTVETDRGETLILKQLNMGIGIVIPSKDIMELLMRDDMKQRRLYYFEQRRKELEAQNSSATLSS